MRLSLARLSLACLVASVACLTAKCIRRQASNVEIAKGRLARVWAVCTAGRNWTRERAFPVCTPIEGFARTTALKCWVCHLSSVSTGCGFVLHSTNYHGRQTSIC
ncbi:hypothetical protein BKA58DRAFT_184798 [Alternaria rosae]|uniref:uncharacterized protein n=1 Tax=Alternaria rosae TaxID=1187941 RepID=UPI001E8DEEC0|nr:uncharacterized protein BKA58DRAFT_184798 [Alternaria rosae]KAH6870818.1 hypothetical protein BKA58DRAFT_184798 [Alternaria rosae]